MKRMQRRATIDPALVNLTVDQRVMLRGVSWDEYETLLAIRGEDSVPRMTYLEGTLELMTPSREHEILKTTLARLLEAYAEELGLELEGYGSWILKHAEAERGAEPDECYSIGRAGEVPDIAIEVNWTSGGLDKVDVYNRLGVREVWMWDDGAIAVWVLRGERYERASRSERLPQVDLELLCSLIDLPTQTAAVRELRARLRAAKPPQ
jgi:Uma2 family endonuclease